MRTLFRSIARAAPLLALGLLSGCEAPSVPSTEPTPGAILPQWDVVGLAEVTDGLTSPLTLMNAPDSSGRRFIVDQIGLIRILMPDGTLLDEPFLDVRDRLVELMPAYDERGLLGLAFHPDFAQNRRFFIHYSAPLRAGAPAGWNDTSTWSEFLVSASDPNRADPNSELILIQIDKPQFNHNGGAIAFGPDGYLYMGIGDGGAANDVGMGHPPIGNGQDYTTPLGNILRIDVDSGSPYAIPPDNPFVGREGVDEIFAYGFRNPYGLSFDLGDDHRLLVSDAGQDLWEEVDNVVLGGNYGWRIKEGTHCFDPDEPDQSPATCPSVGAQGEPLIDPVIEFANSEQPGGAGVVVVGGYVYRGIGIPRFQGRYLFGSWSRSFDSPEGVMLEAFPTSSGTALWKTKQIKVWNSPTGEVGRYVLGFGQDEEGEVYLMTTERTGPTGTTGKIFKLVSIFHAPESTPTPGPTPEPTPTPPPATPTPPPTTPTP